MDNNLTISSPQFSEGAFIPEKYTADGANINPPLAISGVSDRAVSLVLIVDDPDAATDPDGPGKTYDHWVVFNIPPSIKQINEDSAPEGSVIGKNGSGQNRYYGPAPPNGTHRYFFKLYGLSAKLNLDSNASKQDVENAMEGKVIQRAQLMAEYSR